MNIFRLVIFVAVVFMCPGFLSASDTSTELAFPDLLVEDFLDDENFLLKNGKVIIKDEIIEELQKFKDEFGEMYVFSKSETKSRLN